MSETLGTTVLRRVAEHYRTHPGSWTACAGSLANQFRSSAETIQQALENPVEKGCIHTMIVLQAKLTVGDNWRIAEAGAIAIMCRHFGSAIDKREIFKVNDNKCKTAADAIAEIEQALEKDKTPPVVSSDQEIKPTTRARERVLAAASAIALAALMVSGTVLA